MKPKHIILWRTLGVALAWIVICVIANWLATGLATKPPSEGFHSLITLLGLIGATMAATVAVIVGLSWLPG